MHAHQLGLKRWANLQIAAAYNCAHMPNDTRHTSLEAVPFETSLSAASKQQQGLLVPATTPFQPVPAVVYDRPGPSYYKHAIHQQPRQKPV
jgi:hypothetical protein